MFRGMHFLGMRFLNRKSILRMGMGVQVDRTIAVTMAMKMQPIAHKSIDHLAAQYDQYAPNQNFQKGRKPIWQDRAEQDRTACDDDQGQTVTKAQITP